MSDNNSVNETIDTVETPVKKKRKPKAEALIKCKVLKGFCIKENEFIPLYTKNSEGKYVTHKIETRNGAIRHERTVNIVELNLDDMKAALRLKAIEIVDD